MIKRAIGRGCLTAGLLAGLMIDGPALAERVETVRGLTPHRAVYELALARRGDRSEITAVGGRLVFEFSGSVCEGWSSRFRLVTRLTNSDGTPRVTDMRTTSFEDGEGKTFEFVNQNLVDGRVVEDTKGSARHDGGSVRASITAPETRGYDLPGSALFPTEHMVEIVEAAKAGRSVAEIDLYDGTEGGARHTRTTVIIGREQTGADDVAGEAEAVKTLTAGKRRWQIDISYFDPTKEAGDATPDYQLGFLLYENGVSRRLKLDYGDFAISGSLTAIDGTAAAPCP